MSGCKAARQMLERVVSHRAWRGVRVCMLYIFIARRMICSDETLKCCEVDSASDGNPALPRLASRHGIT